MFKRFIEESLTKWSSYKNKRPLVIRGARQTGKTTLVREFGQKYELFIELNLEKAVNQKIFSTIKDIKEVILSIESIAGKRIIPDNTLIFLDEIQNSPNAIASLRYFYEEAPHIHVISAGSLLEVKMKKEGWSFPVGRVEFMYLYPATFEEFLNALGEDVLLQFLRDYKLTTKMPTAIHEKLTNLLSDYMAVGGMPQAIQEYISNQSFISAKNIHEILISTFKDDFIKYSTGVGVENLITVWDRVPFEIGNRIKYSSLGGLQARSQYISKAFDILHSAMLIERVFPTTQVKPPLVKKEKSAPKSIFLDIGLCTHALNITRDQIKEKLIDPRYTGALFEQFVGQEILAMNSNRRSDLFFWIREEKGSSSELDYIIQTGEKLLPIEVKSGNHGSLKSLHQFLARSEQKVGVRLYNGLPLNEFHDIALSNGDKFDYNLVSLPIYLTSKITSLLI